MPSKASEPRDVDTYVDRYDFGPVEPGDPGRLDLALYRGPEATVVLVRPSLATVEECREWVLLHDPNSDEVGPSVYDS